ncbi:DNA repair protein RecO [bacterium (Candidatus Gribaldobacteria) CG23_combo_of_CG06-09_8_20_14_all_37_87_8]|uniref:DNA repair protein RecO n=2 Tax=Candidatus Gribaldobacteria TaxID=2798536 RepID=A0A2G9ZH76_9BACT|nr:MAG: DNA repair protein RecO [Parcubacteria group bacterium CG1_02_37_13]PIP31698.1 MAG: DNA repair protein RecO [bacterium (Candidatus Gribaldobacteria) CG23_combo_of_CG06-09_8_20_14_all_37_87_8]PIR90013.1 MAG: DNA repair protein RecO [bacterium (Candidatus Gribaldobacteria) CG10_big_fil_rev_8_21_14_0_10_37_21]
MAYHHLKTEALFLKKSQQKEADFLFTLYTKEFGKIKVIGKAIRKANSKLQLASQLFYLAEVEFIEGKVGKILTDALLLEKFDFIYQNEEKFLTALEIANKIDQAFPLEQKDEKMWQLLLKTICSLEKAENQFAKDKAYPFFLEGLQNCLGCSLED